MSHFLVHYSLIIITSTVLYFVIWPMECCLCGNYFNFDSVLAPIVVYLCVYFVRPRDFSMTAHFMLLWGQIKIKKLMLNGTLESKHKEGNVSYY